MSRRKVIDYANLPTKVPLFQGFVVWLLLDKFNAPTWLYGAMATLFGIVIIGSIIDILFRSTMVKVLKD